MARTSSPVRTARHRLSARVTRPASPERRCTGTKIAETTMSFSSLPTSSRRKRQNKGATATRPTPPALPLGFRRELVPPLCHPHELDPFLGERRGSRELAALVGVLPG